MKHVPLLTLFVFIALLLQVTIRATDKEGDFIGSMLANNIEHVEYLLSSGKNNVHEKEPGLGYPLARAKTVEMA